MVDFSSLVNPEKFPNLPTASAKADPLTQLSTAAGGAFSIIDEPLLYKNPQTKGQYTYPGGKKTINYAKDLTDEDAPKIVAEILKDYEAAALLKVPALRQKAILEKYADDNAEKLKVKTAAEIEALEGKDKDAAIKARTAKIKQLTPQADWPKAIQKEMTEAKTAPKAFDKLSEEDLKFAQRAIEDLVRTDPRARGIPVAKVMIAAVKSDKPLHYARVAEALMTNYESIVPKGGMTAKSIEALRKETRDIIKALEAPPMQMEVAAPQLPLSATRFEERNNPTLSA